MDNSLIINLENHRSRERIKDMGEVFTPEQYVQQMLGMFDEKIWTDENVIFFEPSCGHGNIALPILGKRISALTRKYTKAKIDRPVFYGVANALNTLWAIDICPENIDLTRKRIFDSILRTLEAETYGIHQAKTRNFLTHVLCTLIWQIHENEALSSLSVEANAYAQASKTKLGADWFKTNKHRQINFKMDWCEHYMQSVNQNIVPIIYQRALRFMEGATEIEKIRGFEEFNFAREVIQFATERRNTKTTRAGNA